MDYSKSLSRLKSNNFTKSELPSEPVLVCDGEGGGESLNNYSKKESFAERNPAEAGTATGSTGEPISTLEVSSTSSESAVAPAENRKCPQELQPPSSVDRTKFHAPPLSDIPFEIEIGGKCMTIGKIHIKMRAAAGTADVTQLTNFWKLAENDPLKQKFPSTEQDMFVVSSSVCQSVNTGLSAVADAFFEVNTGEQYHLVCGCFLATKLTFNDFIRAMTQSQGGDKHNFSSQWAVVLDLFFPVRKVIENLLQYLGHAAFINALIIDTNVLHKNNPELTLQIYKNLFGYSIYWTQKKGFRFALYIAKDKNEVIIFINLGFSILRSLILDSVNEITLMIWRPAKKF